MTPSDGAERVQLGNSGNTKEMTDKLDVEGMRDALARIIDPEAWSRWDIARVAWVVKDSLAKADAILSLPQFSALLARVEELEGALRHVEDMAYEGANDLQDPLTPTWDCHAINLPIITRNVGRLASIGDLARSALSPSTLAKEPSDAGI